MVLIRPDADKGNGNLVDWEWLPIQSSRLEWPTGMAEARQKVYDAIVAEDTRQNCAGAGDGAGVGAVRGRSSRSSSKKAEPLPMEYVLSQQRQKQKDNGRKEALQRSTKAILHTNTLQQSSTLERPLVLQDSSCGRPSIKMEAAPAFKEGEEVFAKWKGKQKWYKATILKQNAKGSYGVRYDDNMKEMFVKPGLILSLSAFAALARPEKPLAAPALARPEKPLVRASETPANTTNNVNTTRIRGCATIGTVALSQDEVPHSKSTSKSKKPKSKSSSDVSNTRRKKTPTTIQTNKPCAVKKPSNFPPTHRSVKSAHAVKYPVTPGGSKMKVQRLRHPESPSSSPPSSSSSSESSTSSSSPVSPSPSPTSASAALARAPAAAIASPALLKTTGVRTHVAHVANNKACSQSNQQPQPETPTPGVTRTLPANWKSQVDPVTQGMYYYHVIRRKATWIFPTDADADVDHAECPLNSANANGQAAGRGNVASGHQATVKSTTLAGTTAAGADSFQALPLQTGVATQLLERVPSHKSLADTLGISIPSTLPNVATPLPTGAGAEAALTAPLKLSVPSAGISNLVPTVGFAAHDTEEALPSPALPTTMQTQHSSFQLANVNDAGVNEHAPTGITSAARAPAAGFPAKKKSRTEMTRAEKAIADLPFAAPGARNTNQDTTYSKREQRQMAKALEEIERQTAAKKEQGQVEAALKASSLAGDEGESTGAGAVGHANPMKRPLLEKVNATSQLAKKARHDTSIAKSSQSQETPNTSAVSTSASSPSAPAAALEYDQLQLYVDSAKFGNYTRFANDYRNIEDAANACFKFLAKPRSDGAMGCATPKPAIFLSTQKQIPAGAEVLVDYGESYWENFDTERDGPPQANGINSDPWKNIYFTNLTVPVLSAATTDADIKQLLQYWHGINSDLGNRDGSPVDHALVELKPCPEGHPAHGGHMLVAKQDLASDMDIAIYSGIESFTTSVGGYAMAYVQP